VALVGGLLPPDPVRLAVQVHRDELLGHGCRELSALGPLGTHELADRGSFVSGRCSEDIKPLRCLLFNGAREPPSPGGTAVRNKRAAGGGGGSATGTCRKTVNSATSRVFAFLCGFLRMGRLAQIFAGWLPKNVNQLSSTLSTSVNS
jgi:hypothetical protein